MAETPQRNIRVDDVTWDEWKARALSAGLTVTDLIHRAMLVRSRGGTA